MGRFKHGSGAAQEVITPLSHRRMQILYHQNAALQYSRVRSRSNHAGEKRGGAGGMSLQRKLRLTSPTYKSTWSPNLNLRCRAPALRTSAAALYQLPRAPRKHQNSWVKTIYSVKCIVHTPTVPGRRVYEDLSHDGTRITSEVHYHYADRAANVLYTKLAAVAHAPANTRKTKMAAYQGQGSAPPLFSLSPS